MNEISMNIGKQIKLLRKIKNMTLEDFSKKINKSVSTVSKYENGNISIDIETLFDIAKALETDIVKLINVGQELIKSKELLPSKTIFGSNNILYMYYLDGNTKKIVNSLIHLSHNAIKEVFEATLYMNIHSFNDFHNCSYLYFGNFYPFDTISSFQFQNQANNIEQLSITLINPLNTSTYTTGLLAGIAGYPFLPGATKVILSKSILKVDETLIDQLKITKEEIKYIKKSNQFIIMRI